MKKIFLILTLLISTIFAQDITFKSGENKVNLIELYTSQGCSSCPPADAWLGSLKEEEGLFKEFIPLAFHVTYWDFIGWKDKFATKLNDNRQRYYSQRVWQKDTVYTPQFVINAREYRQWFSNKNIPSFEKEYGGNLSVRLLDDKIEVNFYNKQLKNQNIYLNVAVLGFDFNIDIKKGENKYKKLEHDFVVLNHTLKFSKIKNNRLNYKLNLPKVKVESTKYALVVWLSDKNSNIIQASGGYF